MAGLWLNEWHRLPKLKTTWHSQIHLWMGLFWYCYRKSEFCHRLDSRRFRIAFSLGHHR
jgi:hypothetical protein